jgi:hypothetical protein
MSRHILKIDGMILAKMDISRNTAPMNPHWWERGHKRNRRSKENKMPTIMNQLTAQEFIQKNLFSQAVALKKIIFRMDPSRDPGEKAVILDRLHEQMLETKTEDQKIDAKPLQGNSLPATSTPDKISLSQGSALGFEPSPTN